MHSSFSEGFSVRAESEVFELAQDQLLDQIGEGGDGAGGQDFARGERHAEGGPDRRGDVHAPDRVAAELEEVVLDADRARRPSTSAQIRATASLGRRCAARRAAPGARSSRARAAPRRSSLPLGVSGSASSGTNADGTMYSGRTAAAARRTARRRSTSAPAST